MARYCGGLVQLGVRAWWSPAANPGAGGGSPGNSGFLVGAEIAAGVPVLRAVGAKNGEMLLALKNPAISSAPGILR